MIDWTNILLALIGAAAGGGAVSWMTAHGQKRQSEATADSMTIDNTEKLNKMWQELAMERQAADKAQLDAMTERFEGMLKEKESREQEKSKQIDALTKEVAKLNRVQKKILELLNKISHDNLEQIIGEIKDEVKKDA